MPVGASGQAAGSGRAVAVSSRTVASGGATLSAVVHASGSALVFALGGAALGHRAAVAVRRGRSAALRVRRVLLHTVVGRRRHTGHITGWCLEMMMIKNE